MRKAVLAGLDRVAELAVILLMATLFVLVLVQIIARSSGFSIPATEELTRYTLVWLAPFACYPWPLPETPEPVAGAGRWRDRASIGSLITIPVVAIVCAGFIELSAHGLDQRLTTLPVTIAWVYGAAAAVLCISVLALMIRFSLSHRA